MLICSAEYATYVQQAMLLMSAGYAYMFSRLCYHVQQAMLCFRVIIKVTPLLDYSNLLNEIEEREQSKILDPRYMKYFSRSEAW